MAEIYSSVLVVSTLESPGDHEILLCQPGEVLVVRTLVLGNAGAQADSVILYQLHGDNSAWLYRDAISAQTTEHLEMRAVLEPGDSLHVYIPTGPTTVYAAGYRFTSVAASSSA